jgi:hypothetical protein
MADTFYVKQANEDMDFEKIKALLSRSDLNRLMVDVCVKDKST